MFLQLSDIVQAREALFNSILNGDMDPKTAAALHTQLKGSEYTLGKLKIEYAKLILQARIKKVEIPKTLLPDLRGFEVPHQLPEQASKADDANEATDTTEAADTEN